MDAPPMFNSVEDECRYWKERAKLYHKEWTDVKQEYDEYVEQSRQMEAEMDATLDQKLVIIKDLRLNLTTLEKENESFKLKLESYNKEIANIEKQLDNVKMERDSMKEYMRQLEQKNDDLERAHRILNESIVDFERMLDKAYEKNALLEMEVDEKEILQEKLQRLMDETRDLKQELNVKSRYTPSNSNNTINPTATNIANGVVNNSSDILGHDTNIEAAVMTNNTASTTNINDYNSQQRSMKNHTLSDPDNLLNGNAMTASSRTTALNIVADMLRKLNLDKALLCPQCDKFRCVCDRLTANDHDQHPANSPSNIANNNVSRISRSASSSLSVDFSSHSINTCTATVIRTGDDSSSQPQKSPTRSQLQHNTDASLLLRSTSRNSLSNLNFGTNIFKRFAERMSGNVNNLSTSSTQTVEQIVTNNLNNENIRTETG